MRRKTIYLFCLLTLSQPLIADVQDIDDGAPETMDDQIRQSVTPPQYSDQEENQNQQGRGPYIYNGYPYPFLRPYGPSVGNVNPTEQPSMLRRR